MDIRTWKPAAREEVVAYVEQLKKLIVPSSKLTPVYVTYLLYLCEKYDTEGKLTLSEVLEKKFTNHQSDLEFILRDRVTEDMWQEVKSLHSSLIVSTHVLETVLLDTTEDFAAFAFPEFPARMRGEYYTPDTVVDLVNRILYVQPNEKVCDICGGIGTFTLKSYMREPKATYYSKELNDNIAAIIAMRADILEALNIHVEVGDILNYLEQDMEEEVKFDKLFGHFPWMMSNVYRDAFLGSTIMKDIKKSAHDIETGRNSEWLFCLSMIHMMKDSGKAVGIVTNGAASNKIGSLVSIRRELLMKGYIEAVIALPGRVFKNTPAPVNLIVFSRGNTNVRLIDATNFSTEKLKQNIFTSENIEEILKAYKVDSEYSCTVDYRDMIVAHYSILNPSTYLTKKEAVKDGVALQEVLVDVYRGAPIGGSAADAMISEEPTDCQYLKLQNINDGMIDEELPYVSNLEERYTRFIAPHKAIVLSKMGPQFKSAVVDVESDRKILVSNNMFILQMDETKINPYYLQALFESTYGNSLLNSISVGGLFPTFSKGELSKMTIPLPSMEKQNKIAKRYLAIQEEIIVCRKKLMEKAHQKAHLFDVMQEN